MTEVKNNLGQQLFVNLRAYDTIPKLSNFHVSNGIYLLIVIPKTECLL